MTSTRKSYFVRSLFFVLTAFAAWALGRSWDTIFDYFKEKDLSNKYIAVVMSQKNPTFTIPKEFLDGFGQDNVVFEARKGQRIKVNFEDDFGSKDKAKLIADKLVGDKTAS